jgi:hypothetical protein
MNKPLRENWTTGDISGFGFAFTLVLLATILSAYTDHPVFWLLVGPGSLVVGLTLIAFLRHLFTTHRGLAGRSISREDAMAMLIRFRTPVASPNDESRLLALARSNTAQNR